MIEDFQLLLRNIPKNKPIVICGDLNYPEANWKTLYSHNETENKVMEMFEEKLFRQIIDFPTCGNSILDTAFYQNCHLSAELDKSFTSIYNLTNHVYPKNLLGSRNTDRILNNLRNLRKPSCLPKVLMNDTKRSSLRCEQVNMLNHFFHSVFSPKSNFSLKVFKVQKSSLANFDNSKNTIRNIMDDIDATKSRGPNGIPRVFYVKISKNLCNIMLSVLRNIKRLRKTPDSWKVAAIAPIFKYRDWRKFENYLSVSLLNIDSKILEKCIYNALYNHFQKFLT